FRQLTYQRMQLAPAAVESTLQILPSAPHQGDQGLVTFLRGNWQFAGAVALDTCFGLVATSTGFATGVRVTGSITDLVAIKLDGIVIIDPKSTDAFALSGHSQLSILNDDVFNGTLSLTNNQFAIAGQLDLFPKSQLLRVTGWLSGQITDQDLF